MRVYKTPGLIQALLPGFTWRRSVSTPTIYLTFDDGPIPDVTEMVLAELAKYQAQATFFCVGDNIVKHPDIAQKVAAAGHTLANHTHHHFRGWNTPSAAYQANIQLCEQALQTVPAAKENIFFRPPYGSISWQQYFMLKPDYEIIMWEVLTYDFDKNIVAETCLQQAIKNTKAGSIVVFHDSLKARPHLSYVLPRYLAHFAALGFRFEAL